MIPIEFCPNCKNKLLITNNSIYFTYIECINNNCVFLYDYEPINFNYSLDKFTGKITHFYFPFIRNNAKYSISINDDNIMLDEEDFPEFPNDIFNIWDKNFEIPLENTMEFIENYINKILKMKVFL